MKVNFLADMLVHLSVQQVNFPTFNPLNYKTWMVVKSKVSTKPSKHFFRIQVQKNSNNAQNCINEDPS